MQAVVVLSVLAIAIGSGGLFSALPPSVSTLAWKTFWMLLCVAAIRLTEQRRPDSALAQLGLRWSPGVGIGVALLASLPMLATFAMTAKWSHVEAAPLLMTAVVSPFSEEVLFRGYVFLQLYRRAGWSFVAAVGTTSIVFGLAHVAGLAGRAGTMQVVGEVGIIAAGGAFYAWLLVRWRNNLWVPIGLHAFMNLWCYLVACDERPCALATNVGRALTVAAAFAITAAWQPRVGRGSRAAAGSPS